MTASSIGRIAALGLVLCVSALRVAGAQEATPSSTAISPDSVSRQSIAERIEQLEGSSTPTPEVRDQAPELFRSALLQLERAEEFRRAASVSRQAIEVGPAELREIRQALRIPVESREEAALAKLPRGDDLARLESELVRAQAEEAAAKSRREALEKELETTKARPARARERLSELEPLRAEIENGLKAPPIGDEPPVAREARRSLLLARHVATLAEAEMLEQESLSQDIRPVTHEYHMAVVKALAGHGIEIPFPQRDIYVRSVRPMSQRGDGERPLEEAMGLVEVSRMRPESSS